MNFENVSKLSEGFRTLNSLSYTETEIFKDLEHTLLEHNFTLAGNDAVRHVFQNNALFCRSESFTNVLRLITEQEPLSIQNNAQQANLCIMAGGEGFKTAMLEGFSGKDVDGKVKVVMVFKGDHLSTHTSIPSTNELWNTKPKTAQVSLVGKGHVHPEDLHMVSFRFPINFFPLNNEEREAYKEDGINFIVRHYISQKEETVH